MKSSSAGGFGPLDYGLGRQPPATCFFDDPASFPATAARGFLRQTFRQGLLGLATFAGFSASIAHAQYADWAVTPPVVLPCERANSPLAVGSSGRQGANQTNLQAALRADGSIATWTKSGGEVPTPPTGTGFKAIYSNSSA